MEWLLTTWSDGVWYDRVYLLAFLTSVVGFLLFLLFIRPYSHISNLIDAEYHRLSAGHFFLGLRRRKQEELYGRAKREISSRERAYPFYVIGHVASVICGISFGIAFWFFVGSYIYEFFTTSDQEDPGIIVTDYENDWGGYDDVEPVEDSNIHHVEPHWVDGYERSDGTKVDGYWRGGEDGYNRSNPDGDPSNNLGDGGYGSYDSGPGYADDGYDGIGAEITEFIGDALGY